MHIDASYSSLEGHVLIRGEESHELWHLDDLNISTLVDVEVSPGLIEVGVEVRGEGWSGETLMGVEDLLGGGEGGALGHPEFSGWLTTDLGAIIESLGVGSLLNSVLLDHGSHEDVIGISGESGWNDSLVSKKSILRLINFSPIFNFPLLLEIM